MWTTFDVILMPFSLMPNDLDRPSVHSQHRLLNRRNFIIDQTCFLKINLVTCLVHHQMLNSEIGHDRLFLNWRSNTVYDILKPILLSQNVQDCTTASDISLIC